MLRRPFGSAPMPWREMERLRREMNRLFSDVPAASGAAAYPAINIWANEDGAIVTAELPGIKAEDIDISVVEDTLSLSGSREPEELEEGEAYHRRERSAGKFTRTFQLPYLVEAEGVEAVLEKGVLNITLPRAEADKPKKISIKAA